VSRDSLTTLSDPAERYVRLALAIGQHDPDYVDAYFGHPALKPAGGAPPLRDLLREAREVRARLAEAGRTLPANDELSRVRASSLDRQLAAAEARIEMLGGTRLSFDEESRRLYDAVAAPVAEQDLEPALEALDRELPGQGPLIERYEAFRAAFVVPRDRLPRVFDAAIQECRRRTAAQVPLPAGETFTVEYVTGQPWSAYNWFKGQAASVIQVNTDLPVTVDRALDLASHEGYPGHHVHQSVAERALVRDRGWIEFAVYPLFSPQSLVAEGVANAGIDLLFPGEERRAFDRDVLYPAAGLDEDSAERLANVQALVDRLAPAGPEAARRYLDGAMDRQATIAWLARWALMPRDRAEQRTRFFDRYRSYSINYTVGLDLVRAWIAQRAGPQGSVETRWRVFAELLATPRAPSELAQA